MRLRFSIKNALTLFALVALSLALFLTWQGKHGLEQERYQLRQSLGLATTVGFDYDGVVLFKTLNRELVAIKVTESNWVGEGRVIRYRWAKAPEGDDALAKLDALLAKPVGDDREDCGADTANRLSPTIAAGPVTVSWSDGGDGCGYLSPISGVHAKPCLTYRQQASGLKNLKLVYACWEPFGDLEEFEWPMMLELTLPLDEDAAEGQ